MECPNCGKAIDSKLIARYFAARGGSATGASKRRDVDYSELGKKAAAARWGKAPKKKTAKKKTAKKKTA